MRCASSRRWFLQNKELDQHGRTERVRVRQIQWSAGDGMGDSAHLYAVTVLGGPPLTLFEENGLVAGGGRHVHGDCRSAGPCPAQAGRRPGPPVIQQFVQIPLGLGLAFALCRLAGLLLPRQRVASAGPTQS